MEILKKFIILAIVLISAYYFSVLFGDIYEKLFPGQGSIMGAVDLRSLIGLPLSYIFFLSLLFTAFGGKQKYWWMGILLIPAAAVELYLDASHIYFPIALGVVGWIIGWVGERFLSKNRI